MKRHWPVVLALAIYLITTAALLALSIRANDGHLIYPVDDAYVHMAIAKNVALHHVWGITRYGFASSTSSPFWTLMLASTYIVLGVGAISPLVFNVLAGSLIVVTIGQVMRARSAEPLVTFGVLVAVIALTPLPTLTLTGMEHTLHALATLWLVFAAAALLASQRAATTRGIVTAGLLGALVTGLRYEGIFTVGTLVVLFWLMRRWRDGAIVAALGAAPLAAYGLWSMAHGWYFAPNSVLLKAQAPAFDVRTLVAFAAGSPALHNLIASPHVLLLVVAALVLLFVAIGIPGSSEESFLLTLLIGTALLHMQLARAGWFYRYEAYLLVLGGAVFGAMAARRVRPIRTWAWGAAAWPRLAAAVVLLMVVGFPFASRGLNALRNVPAATSNIYEQQYQVGLFLNRFYEGRPVALNDIGAADYLADIRLFDIYGLGNLEIAELKQHGRYESRAIAASAIRQGTDIAIIYPSWLGEYGGVPAGWTKVGEWGVRDNVVLGENAVSFYAVKDEERPRLVANLKRFAGDLPPGVMQAGEYTR